MRSGRQGRLIFLVGLRRSGTNWLGSIIESHPDVVGIPGETYLFARGIRRLQAQVRHSAPTSPGIGNIYADADVFRRATRAYCQAILQSAADAVRPGGDRILERTPDHVFHLDLIATLFPDAHVVHIVRDGRDVARSVVAQDWGVRTVAEAAAEWVTGIEAARAASARLEHYQEVRYETLLAEPTPTISAVFDGLRLRRRNRDMDRTLAVWGRPFNTDRGDPRIQAGKWRDAWSLEDRRTFEAIAGDTLGQLGYERHAEPVSAGNDDAVSAGDGPCARSRLARQLVDRLTRLDFTSAVGLLAADAEVHAFTDRDDWTEHGEVARHRLLSTLLADLDIWGSSHTVDVRLHTGGAVAQINVGAGGESSELLLVLDTDDSAIRRLRYLRTAPAPVGGRPASKTSSPATHVWATPGGDSSTSGPSSTTRSARLPASSEPRSCSWPPA